MEAQNRMPVLNVDFDKQIFKTGPQNRVVKQDTPKGLYHVSGCCDLLVLIPRQIFLGEEAELACGIMKDPHHPSNRLLQFVHSDLCSQQEVQHREGPTG